LAQEVDVIDEKTQAALSQIGREEKAAAADKVSPIVRHRASTAECDGFRAACHRAGPGVPIALARWGCPASGRTRWLNPSCGLVPAIPPFRAAEDVDARLKAGHDEIDRTLNS
jgi:hypothetical protein